MSITEKSTHNSKFRAPDNCPQFSKIKDLGGTADLDDALIVIKQEATKKRY